MEADRERMRQVAGELIAELCSEAGFGWHRRVMMIARLLTEPTFGERERGIGQYLSQKYRHNTDSVEGSTKHCEDRFQPDRARLGLGRICGIDSAAF
jgi:hypothetical protein